MTFSHTIEMLKSLPPLTEEEAADAEFRAKDRAWAALVRVFEDRRIAEKLSYADVGRRIGKTRSQVQRWIASPLNMSMSSFGLLAEGLNADLHVELTPRLAAVSGANDIHPSEAFDPRKVAGDEIVQITWGGPLPHTTGTAEASYFEVSE